MQFPKHKTLPNPENPFLQELQQKQIGFSPLVFCEFFQGMEVLQIYGEESKEYLFAIYFSGKLVGHVYYGQKYSDAELAILKKNLIPPTWDQIFDYVKKTSGIWYSKFDQSQYAFVLQEVNLLKKIENNES